MSLIVDISNTNFELVNNDSSLPKFSIGQKVFRTSENAPAVVLSIESTPHDINSKYVYNIKYDEGASPGNDGTGYWPENSLSAQEIVYISNNNAELDTNSS